MEQDQMANAEDIEKVRQEIMRFRELLNVMREKLQDGEQAYARLFSSFSPEEMANTREKDLQWKVAQNIVADVSPLRTAVIHLRLGARDLEHAFEELYDIIVTVQNPE
jgi:hypothetical protein